MSSRSGISPGPARRWLVVGTILWALIPALSFGLLASVPFAHAAVRLQQRRLWVVTAAYAIASLGLFALATPKGGGADTLFGIAVIVLMVVGTTHAFLLRGRVFTPPPAPAPVQPALAAALAARHQREEARAIATRDIALARELRIGRPELPRQFDDGGLVDVNHVPAQVLVDRLGLSLAQAGQVVKARERDGGFAGPQELVARSGLPEATVKDLGERLLFLAVEPAMDTHDDRPERASPADGTGVPQSGWYPDPQGGRGRRWWDGARWTEQMVVPAAPPAKKMPWPLSAVFTVEAALAVMVWFLSGILGLGAAACGDVSARCYDLYGFAWGQLWIGSLALLVGCGAMFIVGSWTKRVAVKRLAVWVLPVGTGMSWIVYLVISSIAFDA